MIILGLNVYHADSSAAIFVNGVMVAAAEEERFTRQKHWAGFPKQAIEFCLETAGVSLQQVTHIAIGRDPKAKQFSKIAFAIKHPKVAVGLLQQRLKNKKQLLSIEQEFEKHFSITAADITKKLTWVEHHRSHLASAFFASPFQEAAIISIDGSGDFSTVMLATGKGNQITVIDSIDFPHSLGVLYTAFTQLLGFPYYGDEYKIMGLAPYGSPIYKEKVAEIIRWNNQGLFQLDTSFFREVHKGFVSYENNLPVVPPLFSKKMEKVFAPVRAKNEALTQYHKDLAASVQAATEMAIFELLRTLHTKTGLTNVCIAGGVAQNSVANGKITRNTPFKQVYIPSAGHDAGISMGAALYVQHQLMQRQRSAPIYNAYTGSRFSNEQVKKALDKQNLTYQELSDEQLLPYVAQKLADGAVVGWFSGAAEFGPRALGGRSILADPRRNDAKDLLNAKIKRRESFRPFAPSILAEFVTDYFSVNDSVPFMEKVFPIHPEKQAEIPAVTHVDGTGRLQTVTLENNPRYYKLIQAFYQITGCPILLNTSFNENEPIVNRPEEAIACYLRTNMDLLVLENCILER